MQRLLLDLIDAAARHADYADARFVHERSERLSTRNGVLHQLDAGERHGVGIRVRAGGSWGFAAVRGTDRADAEAALARALDTARVLPFSQAVPLAAEPPARGTWTSPAERDPFDVPLEDKLAVLAGADAGLRTSPGVSVTRARFEGRAVSCTFVSTEGALCEQRITECGGGIAAVAVGAGDTQIRSYPASHEGHVEQGGYERFLALDLPSHAPAIGEEAVALLTAPPCPARRLSLILTGEQLGIQIHESIGHAVELDRALGRETSYAGTSYAGPNDLGSLRVGSPLVNVTATADTRGGLGTFRWDDEGVEGRSVPIVREGLLVGFLSSRETATEIGLSRSGGCMRAEGFARQPIVRMTNINLEPGDAGSLEDLVAGTDDGLLIEVNRSWSIDDRRLRFHFSGEAAWEIKRGRRTRLVRDPSYAGITPRFWGSCDAVCSSSEWGLTSLTDCGKGEPGQMARVSHGAAPARFAGVDVGVA